MRHEPQREGAESPNFDGVLRRRNFMGKAYAHVVDTPKLLIVLFDTYPVWIAMALEVAFARSLTKRVTEIILVDGRQLHDRTPRSALNYMQHLTRLFNQDTFARAKRAARAIDHATLRTLEVPLCSGISADDELSLDLLRVRKLHVESESITMLEDRRGFSLLPPKTQEHMLLTWDSAFQAVQGIASTSDFSAGLVFNGRFIKEGAARTALRMSGVPVFAFDRGAAPGTMQIVAQHVHDSDSIADEVRAFSQALDIRLRTDIHKSIFEDIEAKLHRGTSPSTHLTNADRANLVIFTSSSHELYSVEGHYSSTAARQFEYIRRIIDDADSESWAIHIRLHPNSASVSQSDMSSFLELASTARPNVTLWGPKSKVNSYRLALEADLVLTFGSTMTAEATLLGTPVCEGARTHFSSLSIARFSPVPSDLIHERPESVSGEQRLAALDYLSWVRYGGDSVTWSRTDDDNASFLDYALEPGGRLYRFGRHFYRSLRRLLPVNLSTWLFHIAHGPRWRSVAQISD